MHALAAGHARPGAKRPNSWLVLAVLAMSLALQTQAALATPIRLYAAGSLKGVLQALMQDSGLPSSAFAEPVYGPAGLLGERLIKGEGADLFASADLIQPERLLEIHPHALIIPFARNRMCVASRPALGLTQANLLDIMLRPEVRLATSTPGADPGGDYAMAVFYRAETIRPGAESVLKAKALHLIGAPNTMVPMDGHSPAAAIFLADRADALLYYCSGAAALTQEVAGLVNLPLPDLLEVHPTYGMAVLSDDPDTARFALFVLSRRGQAILTRFGFRPIAEAP